METRVSISCNRASSLMPDQVCGGKASKSAVRTSLLAGCIPMQLVTSGLDDFELLGDEGTNISTCCSTMPFVTVPDTTVTGGMSPLDFMECTSVSPQQNPLEDSLVPFRNPAP